MKVEVASGKGNSPLLLFKERVRAVRVRLGGDDEEKNKQGEPFE